MSFMFPVIGKTEWSGGGWMPNKQNHRGRTHAAIDIYAARGQTIVSPVAGSVLSYGSGNIGGNWIQIKGDDGNVYYFAHMDKGTTLAKGTRVDGGTAIGFVGNTGSARTTSPHVHFSVKRNGQAINPVSMLKGGVVAPDLEFEKTGVVGGAGTPPAAMDVPDWATANQSEDVPLEAQQQTPAWFDQLAQYRQELMNQPQQENPTKIQARRVMHGTLSGMANMVRSAGFQTSSINETGIDDPNEIVRGDEERASDGSR